MIICSRGFSSKNFRLNLVSTRSFSNEFSKKLNRGDVVLYRGKFEGETGDVLHSKDRPHVVISSDKVMEVTGRVVVAPMSTATPRYEYEVIIPSNDKTGIDKTSKVVANQIRTGYLEEGFFRIGSANQYLTEINQSLMTCFSDIKMPNKKLGISRGDIVEIDFGKFVRVGIIVSNDIGNHFSQIAMLTHANQKGDVKNEFDLLVRTDGGAIQDELLVQCYMINTFSQGFMDKIGRVKEEDMEKITTMLFKTLGTEE